MVFCCFVVGVGWLEGREEGGEGKRVRQGGGRRVGRRVVVVWRGPEKAEAESLTKQRQKQRQKQKRSQTQLRSTRQKRARDAPEHDEQTA